MLDFLTVLIQTSQMWIQPPASKLKQPFFPFEGFYIAYPDDQRPMPAPMGIVTKISEDPPMMNWIYVDLDTSQVKHGNRTESRPHRVGDWGYTDDDEEEGKADDDDPGGVEFNGEEKFVAVKPRDGDGRGLWEVWWDEHDDKLNSLPAVAGRLVLRISLERTFAKTE